MPSKENSKLLLNELTSEIGEALFVEAFPRGEYEEDEETISEREELLENFPFEYEEVMNYGAGSNSEVDGYGTYDSWAVFKFEVNGETIHVLLDGCWSSYEGYEYHHCYVVHPEPVVITEWVQSFPGKQVPLRVRQRD